MDPVVRHKDFRLFAAMNPPTDASKKDLPPALRRRYVAMKFYPKIWDCPKNLEEGLGRNRCLLDRDLHVVRDRK